MNGVHDMGGMDGFGPVVAERNEPVFHEHWEAVVRTIFERTNGRYFNLDEFRRSLERMPPDAYLRAGYYEKWLFAIESILEEKGVVAADELAGGRPSSPAPSPLPKSGPAPSQAPRFKPGDRIVTRNLHPQGHTRLPRYARGKRGLVRRHYGSFALPDSNAHGRGPDFQPCYAVEFEARELWGSEARTGDRVCIDLWESYLESEVSV
ncbi:MAG TPA: nitrile hydratase subunit beta [Candidatus Limnocylindrales bacterium]|nr:nitrile hydratase subunit beta [Candidatus Limnocylindrales bacterium]